MREIRFRARMGTRHARGFVLIIALLLLLILTLVGTVAMRATTLDFRMATNASLAQRSFESAEAARVIVDALLDGHTATGGLWPRLSFSQSSGSVPPVEFAGAAFADFADYIELCGQAIASPPYEGRCRLSEREDTRSQCSRPDMRIHSERLTRSYGCTDPPGSWTDIWVTALGVLNFGPLVSGQSSSLAYRIYHIRAVKHGTGNTQSEVSWEFRAREADL
jgi:hypothetical protein